VLEMHTNAAGGCAVRMNEALKDMLRRCRCRSSLGELDALALAEPLTGLRNL